MKLNVQISKLLLTLLLLFALQAHAQTPPSPTVLGYGALPATNCITNDGYLSVFFGNTDPANFIYTAINYQNVTSNTIGTIINNNGYTVNNLSVGSYTFQLSAAPITNPSNQTVIYSANYTIASQNPIVINSVTSANINCDSTQLLANITATPAPISQDFGNPLLNNGNYQSLLTQRRYQKINIPYAGQVIGLLATMGSVPFSGANIKMALYADNAGKVGNFIQDAGTKYYQTGGGQLLNFSTPVIVVAGSYWVAISGDNNNATLYTETNTTNADTVFLSTAESYTQAWAVTNPAVFSGVYETGINKGVKVRLQYNSPVSITWSPSNTLTNDTIANPIAFNTGSTTYVITASNSVGCTSSTLVDVDLFKPNIQIQSSATSICEGSPIRMWARYNAGGNLQMPTNINWNNSYTDSSEIFLPVGTHTFTASATYGTFFGGCAGKDTIVVTVTPKPTWDNAVNTKSICGGTSIAQVFASNASQQWYKDGIALAGETNDSLLITSSGYYNVIININGCVNDTSNAGVQYTVQPLPTLSYSLSKDTVCLNEPITFAAITATANTSIALFADANLSNAYNPALYTAPLSLNTSSIGLNTFYATAYDATTQCTSLPYIIAYFVGTITPWNTPAPSTVCASNAPILQAPTGFNNYQWYLNNTPISAANTSSYAVSSSGNYNVQYALASCTNDTVGKSVLITVIPSPVNAVTIQDTFCNIGSYATIPAYTNDSTCSPACMQTSFTTFYKDASLFDVIGNTSGNGFANIQAPNGGWDAGNNTIYAVTTNTVSGCNSMPLAVSFYISSLGFNGGATSQTLCSNALPITLYAYGANATFQWYKNNIAIVGATADTFNVNNSGVYNAIVTEGSCISDTNGTYADFIVNSSSDFTYNLFDDSLCTPNYQYIYTNDSATGYGVNFYSDAALTNQLLNLNSGIPNTTTLNTNLGLNTVYAVSTNTNSTCPPVIKTIQWYVNESPVDLPISIYNVNVNMANAAAICAGDSTVFVIANQPNVNVFWPEYGLYGDSVVLPYMTTTGAYAILTNTVNGCINTAYTAPNNLGFPSINLNNLFITMPPCGSDSVNLYFYNGTWLNGYANNSWVPLTTTTEFILSSYDNVTSCPAITPIIIEALEQPRIDSITTVSTAVCNGTATLTAHVSNNVEGYLEGTTSFNRYLPPSAPTVIISEGIPYLQMAPNSNVVDQGIFGPIPLPFNFKLYNLEYSKFWVSTNGFITFSPLS